MQQQTLKQTVHIEGIGLHSGLPSVLDIKPAPVNTGIVFSRQGKPIPALYTAVADTRNCTALAQDGVVVSTIEHLMSAFYAAGVDNAVVECSALELPIMDGAAAVFLDLLQKAGLVAQNAPRRVLRVLKPVRFEDAKGAWVELLPQAEPTLYIHFEIEFPSKIVGRQVFSAAVTPDIFAAQIAPCRTFCEKQQIDYLQSLGLIKGGSLDNAVVLDGDQILNPGGFRVENECVNHKVLDAVGDLLTSGYRLEARFNAFKSGHFHNNEILKRLFADQDNYEIV